MHLLLVTVFVSAKIINYFANIKFRNLAHWKFCWTEYFKFLKITIYFWQHALTTQCKRVELARKHS
jgi:hypothetical protein